MRSRSFMLVFFIALFLGACTAGVETMPIEPPYTPQPTQLIGGSQKPGAPVSPDNRVNNIGDYAATKQVPFGVDPVTSQVLVTEVIEVRWKIPVPFTITSVPSGFTDDGNAADPIVNPANNIDTLSKIRLRIQWGDSNNRFFKDVLAGQPVNLVGSYVKVDAYISRTVQKAQGTADPSSTFKASVAVLAVEGEPQSVGQPVVTGSGNSSLDPDFGSIEIPNFVSAGRPSILRSLTGYQTSGSDVYVMLFDTDKHALKYVNAGGGGPTPQDLKVENGDIPIYQFLVPSGSNFSFTPPEGLVFQHGCLLAWSSTPGVLTSLNVDPYVPNWAGPWAFNYSAEVLSVPPTIPFIHST